MLSANTIGSNIFEAFCKSFAFKRNTCGPKIPPCGTPLLHICLVTFISFIYAPKSNSFISSFISISFILQIIVHLIHIHHIWFYSYCIIFQPYFVFHFFNQSRHWKLGVSLDKTLIRNIYCIIWSWTPMVLLLLVTS